MKSPLKRGLIGMLALWLAAVACNFSINGSGVQGAATLTQQELAQTAAALVLTAQGPGAAASETPLPGAPSPTPVTAPTTCQPTVTTTMNANLRNGPSTDYAAVGSLLQGASAQVAGKNDTGTWYYLVYADGPGGHAWIAASVVTPACLPAALIVVAAPPLPDTPEPAGQPDLIVSEFSISPETPVSGENAHVRIGAYNQGTAPAGPYRVVWYGLDTFGSPSCSWDVNSTNAKGGRILECDFAFPSWYPINKTSLAIVDADDEVDEDHEGNNEGTISPFGVSAP